jgi:hypothetical protein
VAFEAEPAFEVSMTVSIHWRTRDPPGRSRPRRRHRLQKDALRLAQYFPEGTDLSRWSSTDLEAVATAINNRPRSILGWRTPAEVFEEQLRSLSQPGVATTN